MIENMIKNNLIQKGNFEPQSGNPEYLPQRIPEDGKIDWRRNSKELHDFIRSQTKPYPGAFSTFGNTTIKIWKANPFVCDLNLNDIQPGSIVKRFQDNNLLIKCNDGYILVEDYSVSPIENENQLKRGLKLDSADFKDQIKKIVQRHESKYQDLKVSKDIMKLLGEENERP